MCRSCFHSHCTPPLNGIFLLHALFPFVIPRITAEKRLVCRKILVHPAHSGCKATSYFVKRGVNVSETIRTVNSTDYRHHRRYPHRYVRTVVRHRGHCVLRYHHPPTGNLYFAVLNLPVVHDPADYPVVHHGRHGRLGKKGQPSVRSDPAAGLRYKPLSPVC